MGSYHARIQAFISLILSNKLSGTIDLLGNTDRLLRNKAFLQVSHGLFKKLTLQGIYNCPVTLCLFRLLWNHACWVVLYQLGKDFTQARPWYNLSDFSTNKNDVVDDINCQCYVPLRTQQISLFPLPGFVHWASWLYNNYWRGVWKGIIICCETSTHQGDRPL